MDECTVQVEPTFAAHGQPLEADQPSDGAFDDPAPAIASQLPPVLEAMNDMPAVRRDEVDASSAEPLPQRSALVPAIGNQPRRLLPRPPGAAARDRDRGECGLGEADLGHRGSCQANSERKTRALTQYHKLRALPFTSGTDRRTPFFAGAKVPSRKHSSHWRSPR